MDLSPYDQCRCDHKLCRIGRTCNIIFLVLTLIFISGFAVADSLTPYNKAKVQTSLQVKK